MATTVSEYLDETGGQLNGTTHIHSLPTAVMLGLTVRDYFAAAALTGMLAAWNDHDNWPDEAQLADWAYGYATSMLAERKKLTAGG